MLIINESSVGAFLLTALYLIYLLITPLYIIYFLHLLSTNYKCTQPCYFPPAVQTCCSEAEEDLEYFDMVF
jgi:hypothetical protein